ncbi:hypothetical protein CARUB_v10002357mg [Capsella rubella]|uniref:Uncharacterized protein n=1 Tax=Capsella rubella TaxID=81985 RepID=R0FIK7_9BRAS|nr:hypothetical protein CARUB_v10002357mg [Capsella rubella]
MKGKKIEVKYRTHQSTRVELSILQNQCLVGNPNKQHVVCKTYPRVTQIVIEESNHESPLKHPIQANKDNYSIMMQVITGDSFSPRRQ